MTLAVGDHVVKKVDGKVLTPEDEGHIEFEVIEVSLYVNEGLGFRQTVLLEMVEYTYPEAAEEEEDPPIYSGGN